MSTTSADAITSRFSEVLKTELQRQDRASWHAAVMSGVHFAAGSSGPEAGVSTVDLAHSGIDDRVMVATMEALLRVVPLVHVPAGVAEWSISVRGNPNVTNDSANSIALFLSAVRGVARVDLFGTNISGKGAATISEASQRLTVRPRIVFAQGQSNTSGSEAAAPQAAAATTTSGTTTNSANPRNAARPAMTVSSASSVDIAALKLRRDELLKQEGLKSMDEARQELRRAQSAASASTSSRKSGGGPVGVSSGTVTPDVSPTRASQRHMPTGQVASMVDLVLQPQVLAAAQPVVASQSSRVTSPVNNGAAPSSTAIPAARAAPVVPPPTAAIVDTAASQRPPRDATSPVNASVEGSPSLRAHGSAGSPTASQHRRSSNVTPAHRNPNMVSGTNTAFLTSRNIKAATESRQHTIRPESPATTVNNTSLAGSPFAVALSASGAAVGGNVTPPAARSVSSLSGATDETTATEMPDRQDDLDIFLNVDPTDQLLNLCQAYPQLPHASILDPVALRFITVLNIAQNGLTALHSLPATLIRLDASGNQLTSMAGCFTECRLLLVLNLRRNEIPMMEGLENNLNLRHLFMGRNNISRVSGIGHLVGLEMLDLSYNRIRRDSDLRSLSQNCQLLHLITYGNPIANHRPSGVMRSLMRNLVPTLVALDNELLPMPLRATAAANLSLSPKPATTSSFDDRSSFLHVADRQVNLAKSAKATRSDKGQRHLDVSTTLIRSSLDISNGSGGENSGISKLGGHQASVIAGYSAPHRVQTRSAVIAANVVSASTAQHGPQASPLSKASAPRMSRAEMIARVDAHNATLMLEQNTARIARENSRGRPPTGHTSGTTHHTTSGTSDTVSNSSARGTGVDQGPLATGRGSAASPRSNIPMSRSMSGVEWGAHQHDAAATAVMMRHISGRPQQSNASSPRRMDDVEGVFTVGQHRPAPHGTPNRSVKMSPTLTHHDDGAPSPGARHDYNGNLPRSVAATRGQPWIHHNASPIDRHTAVAGDVTALHQTDFFSPARGTSSLFEGSPSQDIAVTSPAPPTRVPISDLIDDQNDPEDVVQWMQLADQDERTINTALNALLFVLEGDREATTQHFPRGELSVESERCLNVIERRQLTEDMDIPSSVADRLGLSEAELNATFDDDDGAPTTSRLEGRRGKLLEALQRMTEQKTTLRYILAYARAKRYDMLFDTIDSVQRQRQRLSS